MEITKEQYEKIKKYMPKQRGNVSMSNINLINARRIFTRYDKLDVMFCSFIYFALIIYTLV